MNKKGTTIVHTVLAGNQGAHVGSQGSPRWLPSYYVWRGRFRKGGAYGKRKKVWDNEKSENNDSIIFLLLLGIGQKVILEFSELQVFGYLSRPSFFILYCPSVIF